MMQIRLTPTVKALLIAQLVVFILQQTADRFFGTNLLGVLGLVPAGVVFDWRVWQFVTYMFLHGDVMHLVLNLLMLVFIGTELESIWGRWKFLKFFFACGLGAALLYLLMQVFVSGGLYTPLVGSSGGIYGLLAAYGLYFGDRVLLFMLLFPMKARNFIWVLAGVEFMTTLFSPRGWLSSVAHLGGMGAGFLLIWGGAFLAARKRLKQVNKRPSHLRVVRDDDDPRNGPTWH